MKQSYTIFVLLLLAASLLHAETGQPCPGMPTVSDADGNVYNTIRIGNQCWLVENLRAATYQDGSPIQSLGDNHSSWPTLTSGAYTVYPYDLIEGIDSEEDVLVAYGALYNWHAVNNSSGLCPVGWHVPSDADWDEMTQYLMTTYGLSNNWNDPSGLANALKSRRQQNSPLGSPWATSEHPRWDANDEHHGTDRFGFSALPGGNLRGNGMSLGPIGSWGLYWTATEHSASDAINRELYPDRGDLSNSNSDKREGRSVRCVKEIDEQVNLPSVTILTIDSITSHSAIVGGEVLDDGGGVVTERGIVFSTDEYPELADYKVVAGSGTGFFHVTLAGLNGQTTFFVRAFATNEAGTAYGAQMSFTTTIEGKTDRTVRFYLSIDQPNVEDCFQTLYSVTFNVNMLYVNDFHSLSFNPDSDKVKVTGSMFEWTEPGEMPEDQLMLSLADDPMAYAKTITLTPGDYQYKYFINHGWDGGEWEDGQNRLFTITDHDLELNDWFGSLSDPTAIIDVIAGRLNLFPNPANNRLTIVLTDIRPMTLIRVIDLLGQEVMRETLIDGQYHELNVGQLQAGMYVVQVFTADHMFVSKFQIAR